LNQMSLMFRNMVHEVNGKEEMVKWVDSNVEKTGLPPPPTPFQYDLPCAVSVLETDKWQRIFVAGEVDKPITKSPKKTLEAECVRAITTVPPTDDVRVLSFKEGEVILLTQKDFGVDWKGWWSGCIVDPTGVPSFSAGYFESRHVEMLKFDATLDFRYLFQLPSALFYFTHHLEQEFSGENLQFWMAVTAFRSFAARENRPNGDVELVAHAKYIIDQFVSNEATMQVNLKFETHATLTHISQALSTQPELVTRTIFNAAQHEIFKLLESDSYPRFKQSARFQTMLDDFGVEPERTEETDQ